MRGSDETVWIAVQLCGPGGSRSRRSSAADDPGDCERGAERSVEGVHGALYGLRPALDCAGEAASGDAAAGVLRHPLRAPTDGAVGVRPSVPLVCRPRRGRCGLGPFDLLQEPRPAAGGRDRGEVPGGGSGAAEGEAAAVERSLLGGRHADRGVGFDQELPPEGRRRQRQPGAGPQRRAQLPQGEALQRDAPEHDRSGRAALQEGRRAAGQALLHGACPDGEPPWPGGRRRHQPGDRHRRAGDGAGADRRPRSQKTPDHARCGQGL